MGKIMENIDKYNTNLEQLKWYMITTISGKEKLVVESLQNKAKSPELSNIFTDFLIAYAPHLTPKGKTTERNLFPGYIFIKMRMSNESWFIVRNTLYVTGLVGSSNRKVKPTPVSTIEIKRIKENIEKQKKLFDEIKNSLPFKINDKVRIINGVLKDEEGKVVRVFADRKVAVVELIQFGRKTPTEINFSDLEVI